MLSLVDLKDFAEICRAIEEYVASGNRHGGSMGPGRHGHAWARGGEDSAIADSVTPSHRL